MAHPWQHRRQKRIDPVIDRALDSPSRENLNALVANAGRQPTKLAERIRRRAANFIQNAPEQSEAFLRSRDQLLQRLYAAEAPGYLTAWSDAAVFPDRSAVGIGGLLADIDGQTLAEFSIQRQDGDAVVSEIAAAAHTVELAIACGTQRLRLHTDCAALVELWCCKRQDARLQPLATVSRSIKLVLREVPRLHNQRANWLARRSLESGVPQQSSTFSDLS